MPNKILFEHVLTYLKLGKNVIIRVKGNSMLPFLREGDRVLLKPFDLKELTRGSVVLARMNDKTVLHRVVKYDDTSVWLAGDHNLVAVEIIDRNDVVAIVVSLYRAEVEIKLDQRWRRSLGQVWYLTRPLRRLLKKCVELL